VDDLTQGIIRLHAKVGGGMAVDSSLEETIHIADNARMVTALMGLNGRELLVEGVSVDVESETGLIFCIFF
jgi:hypothetical protein